MLTQTTKTKYRTTSQPCRRCKGSGEFCRGICYRCQGAGREFEAYEAPMTAEEIARDAEYQAGLDARAAREAARRARMRRA